MLCPSRAAMHCNLVPRQAARPTRPKLCLAHSNPHPPASAHSAAPAAPATPAAQLLYEEGKEAAICTCGKHSCIGRMDRRRADGTLVSLAEIA